MTYIDAEDLIRTAVSSGGSPIEELQELTVLTHEARELMERVAKLRAERIHYLVVEDDRSKNWVARKLGITHQAVTKALSRHPEFTDGASRSLLSIPDDAPDFSAPSLGEAVAKGRG